MLFQSARQIIGFPKLYLFERPNAHRHGVSICKADYWLPQDCGERRARPRGGSVSICKADYWLPQVLHAGRRQHLGREVSICKADYWLPQARWRVRVVAGANKFQSARQIIGFPKGVVAVHTIGIQPVFQSARQIIGFPKPPTDLSPQIRAMFQSARQIIGFPKFRRRCHRPRARYVSICKADYWLPQDFWLNGITDDGKGFNLQGRLLASPSPGALGLAPHAPVSICKADYWLPQVRGGVCSDLRRRVSICKADYWLPQVVEQPDQHE